MGGLLGIDPSYTRTGLCYFDGSGFSFSRVDFTEPLEKTFFGLYSRSSEIICRVIADASSKTELSDLRIVVEYPPPVSQFSAGMWMLVSTIVREISPLVAEVHLAPPAVGRNIFRNGNWRKSDSVLKARPFFDQKGRLSADEADAFIMIIPLLPREHRASLQIVRDVEYKRLY